MTKGLDIKEAAGRLCKTPRWLRTWLSKHPVDAYGVPYCSQLGRTKVFSEGDVARILDATRVAPCRLSSLTAFTVPIPRKTKAR